MNGIGRYKINSLQIPPATGQDGKIRSNSKWNAQLEAHLLVDRMIWLRGIWLIP